MMPGTGAILYDAEGNTRLALTGDGENLSHTLTALETWVERGVRPT